MAMFSKFFRKIDPEKEKRLKEELKREGGVEKKDIPAMILSAYLVFIPAVLVVFLLFCFVAWMFLGFAI